MKKQKNPILSNLNLRIAVSSSCNLKCVYCEGSAGFRPGKPAAMEDFRRKPPVEGGIGTQVLTQIIKLFYEKGFEGITLTGGEPLLNPEWDLIVEEAARIGMSRIELTTNGILLNAYLNKKGKLPHGLSLVKVSFDTSDPRKFRELTGGGDINRVIEAVKAISPQVRTRANKVIMQRDMDYLVDFLNYCQKIGFHEVTLLDLVAYPNRYNWNKNFFEEEFIAFPQVRDYLYKQVGLDFGTPNNRYRYGTIWLDGLYLIFKDSRVTRRDTQCLNCPIYCQEAIYTARIATDGNITICPDYRAELSSIDGPLELSHSTLSTRIDELISRFLSARQVNVFDGFLQKHKINLSYVAG